MLAQYWTKRATNTEYEDTDEDAMASRHSIGLGFQKTNS